MAERGLTGGLDFRFNQQSVVPQQQQQMYAQPSPAQVEVPEYDDDPLAVREKLTSDYYNSMGMLRSFANDMAKKGIDVFEPDWSQDGGGLAFQTAKKLEAGLMYSANALGNEFKAETQMRPLVAQDKVRVSQSADTSGLYASDPNSYFSTELTPGVEQANRSLAQETNDPGSQNRANALIPQQVAQIDQQVAQGLLSPERGEFLKSQLVPNTWRTQPFAPRSAGSGLKPEDFAGRAELIKKMKMGVVTGDPTVINTLKLVPGVEDVEYVNTGDKVGIQVYMRGQGQPAFIDASKGEGEINAMLNRIEGQKNIPNEAVASFDTRVEIPASNARQVLDEVKTQAKNFTPETVSKLQELAASGQLMTPNGEPIASVEVDGPVMGIFGKTELKITYYKVSGNKVNYSSPQTRYISDPAEIDSYIETNSNQIAPAFGGGFVDRAAAPPTDEAKRAQDLINKYRK